MIVTKDFQAFVEGAMIEDYNEIYEFYNAVVGQVQSTFSVQQANGSQTDILISRPGYDTVLRLNPKQRQYLPSWIETNLMNGMDAEGYWGMKHALEKAEDE